MRLLTSWQQAEKMSNNHEIDTYEKLALGAGFFLEESFRNLDNAIRNDFASILFSKELENLEPNEQDEKIFEKLKLPETPIEILQSELPEIISNQTSQIMSDAWDSSQRRAKIEKHKFPLNHEIESIQILGHLNNLGFFIETLINRHLLFLKQKEIINDFSYSKIAISKIMERIIYIFKDEINSNKIHINEIQNLFRLRNKTVHFTPDNAKALKPKISELIKIWTQSAKLISKLERTENFNEQKFSSLILQYSQEIQNKWN